MVDYKGSVKIGGRELRELTRAELVPVLNVVPQELLILEGTIRFNLDPESSATDAILLQCAIDSGLLTCLQVILR